MVRRVLGSLLAILLLPLAWLPALACPYERPIPGVAAADGVLYDTPIYDPDSKRYFALVWAHRADDHGTNWATAYAAAKERQYKGALGRLAVVDSIEVHDFLLKTFHPPCEAWIGLRYWCTARSLEWANGVMVKPGSFQAWDREWRQDVAACASSGVQGKEYMPVAYSKTEGGFRWIGKGIHKEYFAYFMEFPTGQP